MNESVLVSVIIISLNGLDHLKTCLPPLIRQTYSQKNYEIIIVDNGSQDGTQKYLREHYPSIVVIENKNNEGFAKPNNQAAKAAKGKFLALLNNDMVVKENWLEELLETQSRTGAECVAGTILNVNGSIDFSEGKIDCFGYGYHVHDSAAEENEIFYACGGAMLINRDVYLAVGGLDEDFYLYYEDTDLSWRLWLLGYHIVSSPKAKSIHRHNGTAGAFSKLQIDIYADRNHLCMLYKNYEEHNMYKFLFGAMMLRFLKLMEILRIDNIPEGKIILKQLTFMEKIKTAFNRLTLLIRLLRKTDRLIVQLVTIAGFLYLLPVMRKKRSQLQLARKRTDEEIMEKFQDTDSYFNRAQYKILDKYIKDWRIKG